MKFEKITPNKVRVVITAEDIESMDINLERLKPDSIELHRFLFDIMERIHRETGFDPRNGQITVEASPYKEGLMMIVTRVMDRDMLRADIRNKYKYVRAVKKRERVDTDIYAFKSFDTLCSAIKNIPSDFMHNAALYQTDNMYYFIFNTKENTAKYCAVLREFCDGRRYPSMYKSFLDEHGRIIAQGERLADMAAEISKLY